MKTFIRIISVLLVCVFIGAALAGCSKKNGGDGSQTNGAAQNGSSNSVATQQQTNEYGEPSFTSSVPTEELDFEGEEITILHRSGETIEREWYKDSPEDELDEAVAMRNSAVKETLNLKVSYEVVPWGNYDESAARFNGIVLEDVKSGLHYYDIVANFAYSAAYPAIRDCNADLMDTSLFPYFDFSLPCWNQAIVTRTTVNGHLYYIAGDINISLFDAAMVVWYNKTLYDENREDSDPEHMQDYALAGQWTYAELYMWASRLYEDSNGETGRQGNDTYGYATGKRGAGNPCPGDAIPHAWDLEFMIENPDGTHAFNILGNDKAAEAMTMFRNLFDATGTCEGGTGEGMATVENFAAGCYVFYTSTIYPGKHANMTIREMEDKYGLLPMPKFDSEQENYGTTATDGYSLMTVLDHSDSSVGTKGEAASAYLQLSTEESYTSVRGYYFNRIIKPKYFGTDDSEGTVTKSIALFDIIVANIEFEFWNIYSAQLNNIAWLWRDTVGREGTLESEFRASETAFEDALAATDAFLGLISVD